MEISSTMNTSPDGGHLSRSRQEDRVDPADTTQVSHHDYTGVMGPVLDFYEMETEEAVRPIAESEESFVYRVKTGLAILIAYRSFDTGEPLREGATKDLENMYRMFAELGFQVKYCQDKTGVALRQFLKEITSNKELMTRVDCVAVVISSHGSEEQVEKAAKSIRTPNNIKYYDHYISTFDGEMRTAEIMEMFEGYNCRELRNKPKLFFLQVCRSRFGKSVESSVDAGVEIEIFDPEVKRLDTNSFFTPAGHQTSTMDPRHYMPPEFFEKGRYFNESTDKMPVLDEEVHVAATPCYNDFLVVMASPSEKVAWSDTKNGGWLLYCLYQVVMNYIRKGQTFNLLQAITEVSHMMALTMESIHSDFNLMKCVPSTTHMLTKEILLVPRDVQNR